MKGEGKLRQNDMGLQYFRNHPKIGLALYFGILSGASGVLVDLDHWFNFTEFKGWGLAGRPLHVPLAIIAGCLGVYSYTRLRRLAFRVVLKWALIALAIVFVLVMLEILWAMFMWNV